MVKMKHIATQHFEKRHNIKCKVKRLIKSLAVLTKTLRTLKSLLSMLLIIEMRFTCFLTCLFDQPHKN